MVRVGEVALIDQVLVDGHGHASDRVFPQTTGAIQTCRVEIGAVGAQVVVHLIENPIHLHRVRHPLEPNPER